MLKKLIYGFVDWYQLRNLVVLELRVTERGIHPLYDHAVWPEFLNKTGTYNYVLKKPEKSVPVLLEFLSFKGHKYTVKIETDTQCETHNLGEYVRQKFAYMRVDGHMRWAVAPHGHQKPEDIKFDVMRWIASDD